MAEKYLAFVPEDWQWTTDERGVAALLKELQQAGIVQEAPEAPGEWRNGPRYQQLFVDPDPKQALSGEGLGCDPGQLAVKTHHGPLKGFAGDNLTPVACIHCESEMPYEEVQDAFTALAAGEDMESRRLQMECLHCGQRSPAIGADFGHSGAFACFAVIFEGETSNRIQVKPEGLELLSRLTGVPMTWVQIHGW